MKYRAVVMDEAGIWQFEVVAQNHERRTDKVKASAVQVLEDDSSIEIRFKTSKRSVAPRRLTRVLRQTERAVIQTPNGKSEVFLLDVLVEPWERECVFEIVFRKLRG